MTFEYQQQKITICERINSNQHVIIGVGPTSWGDLHKYQTKYITTIYQVAFILKDRTSTLFKQIILQKHDAF